MIVNCVTHYSLVISTLLTAPHFGRERLRMRNRIQKNTRSSNDGFDNGKALPSKSPHRFNRSSPKRKTKTVFCFLLVSFTLVLVGAYLNSEIIALAWKTSTNLSHPQTVKDDSLSKEIVEEEPEWPSVAIEGVGYPLVKKGKNFVSEMHDILYKPNKAGKILMKEFIEVYKKRPDKVNICGIRFNHALALFVAVRHLNPRLVIESGINAGQSTYFIRKAKKDMEIIALDPEEKPICDTEKRWIDKSGNTKYYVGKDFVDISDFDWVGMARNGTITPSRTLVFLDDHQEVIQRFPALMKAGIKHLVVEDNYRRGEGATQMDRDGQTPKQLFAFRNRKANQTLRDADWLFNNLVSYAEFPPLVPPIMSKKYPGKRKPEGGFMFHTDTNTDIVAPLLRSDLNEEDLKKYTDTVTNLGFDPELKDHESYMQFMNYNQICYLEILPMAWRIVDKW